MPDPTPAATQKSWLPTRKWVAAEVAAAGGLAIALFTGDPTVTDPEKILIITFVVQAITSYLVPNKEDGAQGGVPLKGRGM